MSKKGKVIVLKVDDQSIILVEKIRVLQQLLDNQKQYCVDNYQIGLYNGIVIGLSVLTGEEPKFYEKEE